MSELPTAKIRFATIESVSDAPLKGSIDAAPARNEDAGVESAIDRMVQAGVAEAEAYLVGDEKAVSAAEKNELAFSAKDPLLKPGPISVLISRKTGRLYVRKGFDEVFNTPVTIAQPDRPLGTHVFTALEERDGLLRWNVASLTTDRIVKPGKYLMTTHGARREAAQGAHPARARTGPAGRPRRRARAHHDSGNRAHAHYRTDDTRRFADRVRSRRRASRPAAAPTSSC